MRTVAVLTGIAAADVLAPHADVVLATIADLPEWISNPGN
jgi:phosphoglycolate phosphatase